MEEEGVSIASDSSEALIDALIRRGWCFRDLGSVKTLVALQTAMLDEGCTADVIESELLNTDMRTFGGKSLPDIAALRKYSHIQGPKVLQVSSARDISRNSIAESGNLDGRRLLRLGLTDGHTEITAVEYSHIPSIPDHVVPGTKVRLENKASLHSGILCLNPNAINILGGVVQTLYEEWKMNEKYAGFSRSSLRPSGDNGANGPPPFQKLKIGARVHSIAQQGRFSGYSESKLSSVGPTDVKMKEKSKAKQVESCENLDPKPDAFCDELMIRSNGQRSEEMASSSETRSKEVAESAPVQNQAASQKLLQKLNRPNRDGQHFKGRRGRGKGKQDESRVYTMDEWKENRGAAKAFMSVTDGHCDARSDEELAWQLQHQLDLEDPKNGHEETAAERLRRSMFNFDRDDNRHEWGYGGRGGGGRRKERARGRGRGRFT